MAPDHQNFANLANKNGNGGLWNGSVELVGTDNGIANRTLRIYTVQYPPYELSPYEPSRFSLTAPHLNALLHICRHLNYRCEIQQAAQGNFSDPYHGIFRDVYDGRADVGVDVESMNPERAATFDYIISPYNTPSLHIVIHDRNTQDKETFFASLINIFHPYVWTLLFVSFLLAIFIIIYLDYVKQKIKDSREPKLTLESVTFWTLRVVGSGILLADLDMPRPYKPLNSFYIVTILWLSFALVIYSVGTSTLLYILASSDAKVPPFSDITELADSDFQLYGVLNMKNILKADRDSEVRRLGEKCQVAPADGPDYVPYVWNLLTNGKVAVVVFENDFATLAALAYNDYRNNLTDHCDTIITVFKYPVRSAMTGLILSKNSPHRKTFSKMYAEYAEKGILESDTNLFASMHVSEKRHCLPKLPQTSSKAGFSPLLLADIQLIFYMFISAMCTCFAAFLWERYRTNARSNKYVLQ